MIITGAEEVRNARQFAFSLDELSLLGRASARGDGEAIDEETISNGYNVLLKVMIERGELVGKGLMKKLSLGDRYEQFMQLDCAAKKSLILQLAAIVNASNRQIDLSKIGGAKTAGQYKVTYNKLLNDPNTDFYIVDQSVTGMFERRTRVGL